FIGYETLVVKAKKGESLNIVLKRKSDKKKLDYPEKKPVTQLSLNDSVLYIIDGKEVTNKKFRQLNPDNIQSVTVLKGENAVKNYGERAKDGVIIVTLKDYISSNSNKKYFVKGKVIDDGTGEPLPGASVIILNTTIGTITDLNGEFSLHVDKEKVWLAISYVGYKTIQVKAEKGKYLNLKLERESYRLELDYKEVKKIDDTPTPPVKPTKSFQDEKFVVVEDVPHFPGGNQALVEYISSNIKYPKDALKEGKSGKVLVTVRINEKGEVTNTRVIEAVHPLLDKEALRVISTMPDWKPGTQHGKPVSCDLILPIEFKLE
ncbi:MAG: TonB family protein, partial [Bacteroidetes bacterium]|nr:TonB family protein [Bacteroidota bacterium]